MVEITERERLIEEAEERWGHEWFLDSLEHADGDTYHRIHHSVEQVADGIVVRDVLKVDDDASFETKRWLIDTTEYITQVKEDE